MDLALVHAWKAVCQELYPAFSSPSTVTLLHICTGWVLCQSKPTVTNLICTIGDKLFGHVAKHWTVYHKFFYRAAWSVEAVSRLLLTRIVLPLIEQEGDEGSDGAIELIFDGTTTERSGKQVAFAGYFKDASAGNTLKSVVHWAHNWIVGCVVLRPRRWPNWALALPVMMALYRKRKDCDREHRFATTQQLAGRMIQQVREALPDRQIRACGDGQFATRDVVQALDEHSNLVSRIRGDAALYEIPKQPRKRKRGQPRKKGMRLPTPKKLAKCRKKGWQTIQVRKGGRVVKRRVLSVECLWYHVCKDRPIKLVIVRDPSGHERDDFFFCTDPTVSEVEIVERYYARWTIEESIRDGKQLGGFEQVQGWGPRTVERQAPLAMFIQTLVKTWYIRWGARAKSIHPKGAEVCGWLGEKNHPSYLDMLAALRRAIWDHRINTNCGARRRVRSILDTLRFVLCGAA